VADTGQKTPKKALACSASGYRPFLDWESTYYSKSRDDLSAMKFGLLSQMIAIKSHRLNDTIGMLPRAKAFEVE